MIWLDLAEATDWECDVWPENVAIALGMAE